MDSEKRAENEVKLFGGYNNQLKYSDHSDKDTMEKLEILLSILKIEKIGELKKRIQRDDYYDTSDQRIKRKNGSARIREIKTGNAAEATYLTTIKKKVSTGVGACEDSLLRSEEEKIFSDYEDSKKELQKAVIHTFNLAEGTGIQRQIRVCNERNYCDIKTKVATYELAYDKFRYINPEDQSQSHYYYEIEIEIKDNEIEIKKDTQIDELVCMFKNIMGFEHDGKNKYQRGMEWKNTQDVPERKIFIVFDMVGYSKESSKTQKKKVESFVGIMQKCLSANVEEAQKIPLGDGLILILPDTQNVFSLLNDIFANLNTLNKNRGGKANIKIRTAIHIGNIIEYFDINENRNFAGNGINIAYGINAKAQDGQVLVSNDFYEYLKDRDMLEENNYKWLGDMEIKHKMKVGIYNYYDSSMLVGKDI